MQKRPLAQPCTYIVLEEAVVLRRSTPLILSRPSEESPLLLVTALVRLASVSKTSVTASSANREQNAPPRARNRRCAAVVDAPAPQTAIAPVSASVPGARLPLF